MPASSALDVLNNMLEDLQDAINHATSPAERTALVAGRTALDEAKFRIRDTSADPRWLRQLARPLARPIAR
jgi:hypothetical protein